MNSIPLFVIISAVSMYGGGFATVPAYLRDLFGTMEVGAIHGRSVQENTCGAGAAGVAVCWASLDMGSYAALEECAETISITSGYYKNFAPGTATAPASPSSK
jgi:hypothetical protein